MEDKKKRVTTVLFETKKKKNKKKKEKKKAMCLTKILLPLQCLHNANTLSAQYQITVVALPLFIYTSIGSTCTSSIEKINIDFEYEIVNFGSPNLIILK